LEVKEVSLVAGEILYVDPVMPVVVYVSSGRISFVYEGVANTREETNEMYIKALSNVCLTSAGSLILFDQENQKWEKMEDNVSDFGITTKGEIYK